MEGRIADPRALGFGAFAIGAWMYSMIDAGWFAMSAYGSATAQSVGAFASGAMPGEVAAGGVAEPAEASSGREAGGAF